MPNYNIVEMGNSSCDSLHKWKINTKQYTFTYDTNPVISVKIGYFYALSNFETLERVFSGTIDLMKTHKG